MNQSQIFKEEFEDTHTHETPKFKFSENPPTRVGSSIFSQALCAHQITPPFPQLGLSFIN